MGTDTKPHGKTKAKLNEEEKDRGRKEGIKGVIRDVIYYK